MAARKSPRQARSVKDLKPRKRDAQKVKGGALVPSSRVQILRKRLGAPS